MVFIMFPFVHIHSFFHLCMKIITFYSVCASSSWVYTFVFVWYVLCPAGLLIFILSIKSCVFKMIILIWVFLSCLSLFKILCICTLWYFKIWVETYIPPFSLSCIASFSCLLCAILTNTLIQT